MTAALASEAAGSQSSFVERAAAAGVHVQLRQQVRGLVVDLGRYEATLDGAVLPLTPRQVELLAVFTAAPGRVWSREQLHAMCWGDTAASRRVDVQLCRIRGASGLDLFRNIRERGWALNDLPVAR